MAAKQARDSREPQPLSQQEKMVLAQQEVERYRGLAANPNLSPRAAAWALDMARSAQAEVSLRQKAIAWEAEQANPTEQGNNSALAEPTTLPELPRGSGHVQSHAQPVLKNSLGLSAEEFQKAWMMGQTLAALSLAQQESAKEGAEQACSKPPMDRQSPLERIAQANKALQDPTLREARRQRYIRAIAKAEVELGNAALPSAAVAQKPLPRATAATDFAASQPPAPPESPPATFNGRMTANLEMANRPRAQLPPQMERKNQTPSQGLVEEINKWAAPIGREVGRLWLVLAGVVVLFSFPVSGICASFFVGWWVMKLVEGGAIVLFPAAFLFGLFLSIYVWEPHVKPVVWAAFDALLFKLNRL